MRNTVFSYLLLPLFASIAFSAGAAPTAAPSTMADTMMATPQMSSQAPRLNLNKADAPTLQTHLNGIGKSKAEAIVAYREAHGPFASIDELLEIKGIGSALLERNRDKLTLE